MTAAARTSGDGGEGARGRGGEKDGAAAVAVGTVGPVPAPARAAAAAAAAGFVGLAGFELALALGAPLGRAAMGGGHTVLPPGLRIVAGVAAVFWPVAALVVLRRGGYGVVPIPDGVARAGTWVLTGLLTLGVLLNLASPSAWERLLQAPFAAVLAGLCVGVARGPVRERRAA